MNVFIVGNPSVGKSTLAQALSKELENCQYLSTAWFKNGFRQQKSDETEQHYLDEYHQYFTQQLKDEPRAVVDMLTFNIKVFGDKTRIIDCVLTPKDFTELFDYNKDFVIFLNRVDAPPPRERDNIGVSVIRDYCFWLASAGLIERERWLEFNFKFDDGGDLVKTLGSKNTVIIIKGGIKKVIEVCKEKLGSVV